MATGQISNWTFFLNDGSIVGCPGGMDFNFTLGDVADQRLRTFLTVTPTIAILPTCDINNDRRLWVSFMPTMRFGRRHATNIVLRF